MKNLVKTIQNFSFNHSLWRKGSKIIVGVSGGPDSSCLLDVLAILSPKLGFQLQIAHINYGLRGKDSDRDEALVREKSAAYGLPISVLALQNIPKRGNLEENLRKIRYEYFESLRKELNFDLIAVGHTQDDQAETVLMRLLRGAGLDGLSAMRPRNGAIIRPLLATSRKMVEEYIEKQGISYVIDLTNNDTALLRNKVRHKLLPLLEQYNPNIKSTLASTAAIVAEDYQFIEDTAKKSLKGLAKRDSGVIVFSQSPLLKLPLAIQKECLRQMIGDYKMTQENIGTAHIDEILKILRSTKGKAHKATFQGLKLERRGDRITLSRVVS